ncbi:hypothetical protein [Maribacter stanieri]|nr:hypothetical protein [Maribacter stanieri]
MRKCSIMLALLIVVLVIASQFMNEDENSNENLTIAFEEQKHLIDKP